MTDSHQQNCYKGAETSRKPLSQIVPDSSSFDSNLHILDSAWRHAQSFEDRPYQIYVSTFRIIYQYLENRLGVMLYFPKGITQYCMTDDVDHKIIILCRKLKKTQFKLYHNVSLHSKLHYGVYSLHCELYAWNTGLSSLFPYPVEPGSIVWTLWHIMSIMYSSTRTIYIHISVFLVNVHQVWPLVFPVGTNRF